VSGGLCRRGLEEVPVVRPLASRNVFVPLLSVVTVPVILPLPDIRFIAPNGCSTVHRLILIRLGSA
jgi:hypothetical protein